MASNGGFCLCAFLDMAPLKGEASFFLPFIVASPPARGDNVLLLHLVTSSTEKVSNKGPIDDLDILNNTVATVPPTIPPRRSMSNRDRSAALPEEWRRTLNSSCTSSRPSLPHSAPFDPELFPSKDYRLPLPTPNSIVSPPSVLFNLQLFSIRYVDCRRCRLRFSSVLSLRFRMRCKVS